MLQFFVFCFYFCLIDFVSKFRHCTVYGKAFSIKITIIKDGSKGVLIVASKILEKPEKTVGYVLLAVGLVLAIIPVYFGISVLFSGSSAIPEILKAPTVSFDAARIPVGDGEVIIPISEVDVNEIIESLFPAVNLALFLMIAVILISAGSVIMGKGVSLIKEVKLKAVSEVSEEIEVEKEKEVKKEES